MPITKHTGLDVSLFTSTFDDGGGVFIDGYLLIGAKVGDFDAFEFLAQVFGDNRHLI